MGVQRLRSTGAFFLFLFSVISATAFAEPRMIPGDATGTIKRIYPVGVTTTVNMRNEFLVDPTYKPGVLTWSTTPNKPSWVTLAGDVMSITPPSGATFPSFRLTVMEPAASPDDEPKIDTRFFEITSARPPVWVDPVNLGNHDELKKMSVDLTQYATHPDNEALTFSIIDPRTNAGWVSVNGKNLEGTPQRSNLGDFDMILVATTAKGLSAQRKAIGKVRKVPVPVKFLANPITLPNAPEDLAYSQTINTPSLVQKTEPEPVTFKITNAKPAWLTFDESTGAFSGTPVRADAANLTLSVTATQIIDGTPFSDATIVKFSVVKVNKAPVWSKNPIVLPDAPVKKLATHNLAAFASDIDGNTLTYKKISGPAWADVTTSGTFTGTPTNNDIGQHSFEVEVSDGFLQARTTVQIKAFNTAPTWNSNPVVLKNATEDSEFIEDLRNYSKDADADLLSYQKLNGPTWIVINQDGTVRGTPRRADVGTFTFRVSMTDGFNPAVESEVKVTVNKINKAPEWNPTTITLKDAPERDPYSDTVKPFASDIDGDNLMFEKVSSNTTWATLAADGTVTGTPQRKDVGTTTMVVRVKDPAGLSATATVIIKVLKVNRPPVWAKDPLQLPNALEADPFSYDLATQVTDADGDALVFKKISGPAWQSVAANGRLSGTPAEADVGDYTAVFEVLDGEASVTVNALGKVLKANKPPKWLQDPIVLTPNARALESYANNLATFATDPDGDVLTFKKLTGPGWLQLSGNGLITGIPQKTDVGMNTFTVEVSDGKLKAVATVKLQVDKAFEPPKWAQDPLMLPDVIEGNQFNYNLSAVVTDPENDPLTFKIIRGPAWLTVSSNGQLSGIPQKPDVGNYTAVFAVNDGRFEVPVTAMGRVIPRNDPPKINENALVFTVKERATLSVNLLDPKYISDPDGDKLTFNLIDARDWVVLTSAGQLTLTPKHKDLGEHVLKFTVADTKNPAVNGTLTIQVTPDPQPPKWKTDPIRFTAKAGKLFTQNLVGFVTDVDGMPLKFSKGTGPAWMAVNADGTITGTPSESEVGENTFLVEARNETLGSNVTVIVTVTSGNSAPIWSKNPIVLPDAMVDEAYSQGLAAFVSDPDGDPLKFEKLSGPDWAFLTTGGMFIGVPEMKDLGVGQYRVRVKDNKNAFADVTVLIQVKTKNLPPEWKTNPINLGDAPINVPFTFNLVPQVNNPDNDTLSFKKISGPTWLLVTTDGQVAGTPKLADLGAYTAVFEVTDGTTAVRVDAYGQVIKGNTAPKLNLANLVFTVKERQTLNVNLNQPMYVTDAEGDTLTFEILDPKPWVTLTSNGALTLKPQRPDVGDHTFQLRVTDSKNSVANGPMIVRVIQDSRKPVWLENPIRFTAKANNAFSATLVDKVFNPMTGTTLTFAKISGPAWLTVSSATGNLSGTPKNLDIGANTFVVSATNPDGSSNVDVIIDVLKDDSQGDDSIRIDDPVPGARADNLWVIDNSPTCSGNAKCLIYDLQKNIELYFAALDKAGVHHLGMYYSSDACNYVKPIRDSWSRLLISHEDDDNADSFNERLAKSKGEARYNAPMVQIYRHFRDVPTMSGTGKYYENDVPLDTMIVTAHPEASKQFGGSGSPTAGWGVSEYVAHFKKAAAIAKKPFRISAIAPRCPTTSYPSVYEETDYCYNAYPVAGNPYQQMASETKGKFYEYNSRMSVRDALIDYADRVIFTATVVAHKKIPLTAQPRDPKAIEVRLAGNLLPGNTGSSSDQWTYEASTNSVIIYWSKIDMSTLKPGDRIVITYQKMIVTVQR